MIEKISNGASSNAGLINAVEAIAAENGIKNINVIGNVLDETAAAKAAVPYIDAGYKVSTRTTSTGMTELTRTKTFE